MSVEEKLLIILKLGLVPDINSSYCTKIITYSALYAKEKSRPLVCILPEKPEEYFNSCKKQARYEWRQAQKNGFRIKKVLEPNNDIVEIWKSKKERQGREISMNYFDPITLEYKTFSDKWVEQDYSKYTCRNHRLEFWTVEKDKTVAYMELVKCGKYVIVQSAMGHSDYLKYGIMKYLFIEVIKDLIKRKVKYFTYGFEKFLQDERRHFVKELGITTIL